MKHPMLKLVMSYKLPTDQEMAEIDAYDKSVEQAQQLSTILPSKPKALEEYEAFLNAVVDWLKQNVKKENAGMDDIMPMAIQSLQGEQLADYVSLQAKLKAILEHVFFLRLFGEEGYAFATLCAAAEAEAAAAAAVNRKVTQCKQASAEYLDFLVDKIRSAGQLSADQSVDDFIPSYVEPIKPSELSVYVSKYTAAKYIAEAYTDTFSTDPQQQLEEGYRRYQTHRHTIENKMGTEDANFSRVMRSVRAVLALIFSFGAARHWFAKSWASIWHKEDHKGKVVANQFDNARPLIIDVRS